jgi:hypothetical protein
MCRTELIAQGFKYADIAATPPGHHPRPASGPGPNNPVCARVSA